MAVDKRITYRRNFKGGADMGTVSTPTRAATNKGAPNVSAGGASFNDLGPGPSGNDYRSSARDFVQTLNNNNAIRANQTGTKFTPYGGGSRPRGGGLGNLFKTLFGFATGIPIGLFNKGKSGITSINNALGDFREKFTGYRTQQEYDDARQQRIDLDRINTIQNTLDTKYADGDYSMTDLDERLASLQEGLGITPNTAAQNAQQFLDFSNQPELSYEGIKSLAQPNVGSFGIMPQTMTIPNVGSFGIMPQTMTTPDLGNPYNDPRVVPEEMGLVGNEDFQNLYMTDAKTDNRTLLEKLLNPDLDVDEAIDKEEQKRKREQELLQLIQNA
jgi:hypothetical protein